MNCPLVLSFRFLLWRTKIYYCWSLSLWNIKIIWHWVNHVELYSCIPLISGSSQELSLRFQTSELSYGFFYKPVFLFHAFSCQHHISGNKWKCLWWIQWSAMEKWYSSWKIHAIWKVGFLFKICWKLFYLWNVLPFKVTFYT